MMEVMIIGTDSADSSTCSETCTCCGGRLVPTDLGLKISHSSFCRHYVTHSSFDTENLESQETEKDFRQPQNWKQKNKRKLPKWQKK